MNTVSVEDLVDWFLFLFFFYIKHMLNILNGFLAVETKANQSAFIISQQVTLKITSCHGFLTKLVIWLYSAFFAFSISN